MTRTEHLSAKRRIEDQIRQGHLLEASNSCSRHLESEPLDKEILLFAAIVASRRSRYDEAQFALESYLLVSPECIRARVAHAEMLAKRYFFRVALEEIDSVIADAGKRPEFLLVKAEILKSNGQISRAVDLLEDLVQCSPERFELRRACADALRLAGRTSEAIQVLEASIDFSTAKNRFRAYHDLANLKTYAFSSALLARMKTDLTEVELTQPARVRTCFSIARAHENRGEYDSSFRYLQMGNDIKKRELKPSRSKIELGAARVREVWNRDVIRKNAGGGYRCSSPIFIVGLPRSGSTLVEQILSTHSEVDGTQELVLIPELKRRHITGRGSCDRTKGILNRDLARHIGKQYVDRAAELRRAGRYFTDKLPDNYRNIGFIHSVLPKAKVIDVRRSPADCCFSNYKQLFRSGQGPFYDLKLSAHQYKSYLDIMSYWNEVLPNFVYRINYEDLIRSTELEIRRLLEFCNLPFEADCLEFYTTSREIHTPSSEQVRLPIYDSSIAAWKNYDRQLEALTTELHRLELMPHE